MKVLKNLAIITYFIILFMSFILVIWEAIMSYRTSYSLIYWLIIIGWLFIAIKSKWSSSVSMVIASIFFIGGAILAILGIWRVSEILLELSLIGYLLGIVHALIELKLKKKIINE